MRIEILKRIEAAERRISKTEVPDLVMICYDWERGKWNIRETFMKKDGRGNTVEGRTTKNLYLNHYKDYVVQPDFSGTILLDLMDCPPEFEGNLYSFTGEQIRKVAEPGSGVSFEYAGEAENREAMFNVTVISYAD